MSITLTRFKHYAKLLRLHRPIGIWLLLWPTLWALWIAGNGHPDTFIVIMFVIGVVVMRSAGVAINDFADRHVDGQVSRTKDRPLAAGKISPQEAVILFILLSAIAFGVVLQLNAFTIALSTVGIFLAGIYPFMKRYTYWPQLFLGAAYGWAIPMAFAAQSSHLPLACWLLYASTLLWALAYDTMYAMADRADDLKIGVKSTAILFKDFDKLFIAITQFLVLTLLGVVGYVAKLHAAFYFSLCVGCGFVVYQQYLLKDRQPAQCLKAFFNNHWLGCVIFLGIISNYC